MKEGGVNRILFGDRGVGVPTAVLINQRLGVPLEAWALPPQEPFSVPEYLPVEEESAPDSSPVATSPEPEKPTGTWR